MRLMCSCNVDAMTDKRIKMRRQRRQRKALWKLVLTWWSGNGFALRHRRSPSLMPVCWIDLKKKDLKSKSHSSCLLTAPTWKWKSKSHHYKKKEKHKKKAVGTLNHLQRAEAEQKEGRHQIRGGDGWKPSKQLGESKFSAHIMRRDRGVVDVSHLYNYELIIILLPSFQTLQWLFEGRCNVAAVST